MPRPPKTKVSNINAEIKQTKDISDAKAQKKVCSAARKDAEKQQSQSDSAEKKQAKKEVQNAVKAEKVAVVVAQRTVKKTKKDEAKRNAAIDNDIKTSPEKNSKKIRSLDLMVNCRFRN
jgi:hypothetical protein